MPRATQHNSLTSSELLEKVNPENKKLAREFYRYLKSIQRSEKTIYQYEKDLNIFFVFLLKECENKSIINCTIRDFVNFQGFLLDNGNSPARVRRVKASVSSLSNAIELLYEDEYPKFRNLIKKVESPVNKPVREKTVLSQEQIESILNFFTEKGEHEKACCFALAAYSGRRKAELFRFKVSDFDENNIVLGTFYKSAPILTKGRGGGKKINCFVLAKQFKPYLDRWMEQRKQLGIESEWLFPNRIDNSLARDCSNMDGWAKQASKFSGLDIYPHAFRHALVSYLAKAGLPNSVIIALMQWEKSSGDAMVAIYNDNDASDDMAKYFLNGEILTPKASSITDL